MRSSVEVLSSDGAKFYLSSFCYYLVILALVFILVIISVMLIGNLLIIVGMTSGLNFNTSIDFINMFVALVGQSFLFLFLFLRFVRNKTQKVCIDYSQDKLIVGVEEFDKGDIKYVREFVFPGFCMGIICMKQKSFYFIPKLSLFGLVPLWLYVSPENQYIKRVSNWAAKLD